MFSSEKSTFRAASDIYLAEIIARHFTLFADRQNQRNYFSCEISGVVQNTMYLPRPLAAKTISRRYARFTVQNPPIKKRSATEQKPRSYFKKYLRQRKKQEIVAEINSKVARKSIARQLFWSREIYFGRKSYLLREIICATNSWVANYLASIFIRLPDCCVNNNLLGLVRD